jgi:hypothetical protein
VGGEVTNRVTITNRDVIRDSAVQLGLTHQRGAIGVDSSTCVPEVVNVCVPVMMRQRVTKFQPGRWHGADAAAHAHAHAAAAVAAAAAATHLRVTGAASSAPLPAA